jgi:hypothetical protein
VIENAGTFFLLATQHIFVTFGSNKPDHHPKLRIRFIMRRNRIGLALCASVLTGAISPGLAQTPYDGLWTVTIVTNSGSCEPTASSTLTVTDGKISAPGTDVSGSVGHEGLVKVSINGAYANGQITGNTGSGKWNGASAGIPCSGRWHAARQG